MTGRRVGSTVAGPAALPRWVLLVLLVFGVAGMHTFGHAGPGHGGGGGHCPAAGHRELAAPLPLPPHTGVEGLTDGCGGHPDGSGPAAFTVCLAVLGTVGLVVVLALAGRSRPGRTTATVTRHRIRAHGRAPPVHPFGLRLRATSVLRI
ncbi:MAG TPA: hypothetical protein VGD43_08170 [Micromonospora sp.]